MRYLVRLSVPRAGGWCAWGTVRGEFGRQLAEQESAAIALHVDSEIRRGRDYIRVVVLATAGAGDVAEAPGLAWWAFRKAAGEDLAGWDLASAAAEVRPETGLGHPRAVPRRASSERQRPAHVELVHLMARQLRGRAGAVGVAGQLRPAAARPGQGARRAGEFPGAAGYLEGELRCPGEQAAVRVENKG